jgi:catechol 2,3-dioxygenase-like lactoylglutathione lyase family enzyme
MNNASCRCFRFPIDIGRTSMPCLVATPTVVPYHAGQEGYFNGLLGDGNAPGYVQIANTWLILNVGGGPTPDKPSVTLSVPDPDHINSFMNMRVADIQACHKLWTSRGAKFITEPMGKYGEIRCYIRDPDGYLIEVGQSTDVIYG